jgi:hypothetical protein
MKSSLSGALSEYLFGLDCRDSSVSNQAARLENAPRINIILTTGCLRLAHVIVLKIDRPKDSTKQPGHKKPCQGFMQEPAGKNPVL